MKRFLSAVACLAIMFTAAVGVEAFNSTNKLLDSLSNLQTEVSASVQCYQELTEPFIGVATFLSNISGISQNLTELSQRSASVQDMGGSILKMPGVNSIDAPALVSLTSGLTVLSGSVESVRNKTSSVVGDVLSWEEPMNILASNAVNTRKKLAQVLAAASKGKRHISQVAREISMMQCGKTRFGLLGNMEAGAYGMHFLPNMVRSQMKEADNACRSVKNFFVEKNSRISPAVESIMNDITEVINNALEAKSEIAKEVLDFINDKADDFVDLIEEQLKRIGPQTLVAEKTTSNVIREKREACVTVRQILEDDRALTGQNKTVVQILLRETLQITMPKIPRVSRKLKLLEPTLQTFQSDFELRSKASEMVPSYDVINNFLAMDYVRTFWERPAREDMVTSQTCEGEEKLRIPE